MIAHQWRQPLTTLSLVLDKMNILNQMNQLNTKVFDEQYTKSINLIQYMSKTINDFKNFFQDSNSNEKILLEELIYQSYELIAPALNEKSVNLKIVIGDDCHQLLLKINSSKISQVFLNLYKNSLDEFKSKQIEDPYIQTKCYKNSNHIIIEISDNAGGIPQNIIDKIFDPYFSTKSKNGTGIGLYMSKIIIEQHLSGLIEVANENNGACFKIMLPLNLIS
jgi:C4-dicarboxylate-specific signal transduction histidine kinase